MILGIPSGGGRTWPADGGECAGCNDDCLLVPRIRGVMGSAAATDAFCCTARLLGGWALGWAVRCVGGVDLMGVSALLPCCTAVRNRKAYLPWSFLFALWPVESMHRTPAACQPVAIGMGTGGWGWRFNQVSCASQRVKARAAGRQRHRWY